MTEHDMIWLGLAFLTSLMSLVALEWAQAKRVVQVCIVSLVLAFNVAIYTVKGSAYNVHWFDLLQRQEKSIVLSYVLIEDNGIFYWLMPHGAKEPFYLKRPWNQKEAQALQDKYAEARRGDMLLEFDPDTWLREFGKERPRFNLKPKEPALKGSPENRDSGVEYQHPGYDI